MAFLVVQEEPRVTFSANGERSALFTVAGTGRASIVIGFEKTIVARSACVGSGACVTSVRAFGASLSVTD
jgi:hypothetical protein